jgi:hypothetical protein
MKKGCKQEKSLPFATFFIAGMKYHIMLYVLSSESLTTGLSFLLLRQTGTG